MLALLLVSCASPVGLDWYSLQAGCEDDGAGTFSAHFDDGPGPDAAAINVVIATTGRDGVPALAPFNSYVSSDGAPTVSCYSATDTVTLTWAVPR